MLTNNLLRSKVTQISHFLALPCSTIWQSRKVEKCLEEKPKPKKRKSAHENAKKRKLRGRKSENRNVPCGLPYILVPVTEGPGLNGANLIFPTGLFRANKPRREGWYI